MALGGEIVGYFGEVTVFPTSQEADQFLGQLRARIAEHRTSAPNSTTWSVPVVVHLLDSAAISRHAQERKAPPYPGAAVVFLDRGAVHACQEFGIVYTPSNAPNQTLPTWASPAIKAKYCSTNPFAGADPCH